MENIGHSDVGRKAFLYGIALFLAPFADKVVPVLFEDKWPSVPSLLGCALLGVISCSIGLRAYYDGSYERSKNGYLKGPPGVQGVQGIQGVQGPQGQQGQHAQQRSKP